MSKLKSLKDLTYSITNPKITTDYSRFKLFKFNRVIDPAQVAVLIKSILELGDIFRPVQCVEIGKYLKVIDGQHLLYACMELEVPVPYIVVNVPKDALVKYVALINNTQKNWDLKTYMNCFACFSPDYQKLKFLHKELSLVSLNVLIMTLSGNETTSTKEFRTGNFTIANRDKNILISKEVNKLLGNIKHPQRRIQEVLVGLLRDDYQTEDLRRVLVEHPILPEGKNDMRNFFEACLDGKKEVDKNSPADLGELLEESLLEEAE